MQLFDPPYKHPSRTLNRSHIPSLKADRADGHRNPIRSLRCTVRIQLNHSWPIANGGFLSKCRIHRGNPTISEITNHFTRDEIAA